MSRQNGAFEARKKFLHGIVGGLSQPSARLETLGATWLRQMEAAMSLKMSLGEIIANLEAQIVSLRERVASHAKEEEHHRAQRALLEAELQTVSERYEALKAAATPAAELVRSTGALAALPEAASGPPTTLSRMVVQIIEARPDGEPFGLKDVSAEVNQRFRAALGRPADPRSVSAALRRMLLKRRIHLVREGKPFHEALYAKGPGSGKAPPL